MDTDHLAHRRADARRIWETSAAIPLDGEHSARRWATRRNLWRGAFPIPSALRWLDAADFPDWMEPSPDTAGAIIALIAPPASWVAAWPGLPAVQAVQILPVRADGSSDGLEKRTRGAARDNVCIFGNPHPDDAQDPTHVAEGIADALALSSRYPGPTVATVGTSGFASATLATWLASLDAGAVIVADADPVNPRTGQRPGQVAAGKLRWRIQQQGGSATALWPTEGKDYADLAAGDPFPPLGDTFGGLCNHDPGNVSRLAALGSGAGSRRGHRAGLSMQRATSVCPFSHHSPLTGEISCLKKCPCRLRNKSATIPTKPDASSPTWTRRRRPGRGPSPSPTCRANGRARGACRRRQTRRDPLGRGNRPACRRGRYRQVSPGQPYRPCPRHSAAIGRGGFVGGECFGGQADRR